MKMALKTLIMASFEFLDTFPEKNGHLFKKAWLVMNKTSFIKSNRIYFHLILQLVVEEWFQNIRIWFYMINGIFKVKFWIY